MRFYAVVTLYINRSCFKLRFHDTEVFFDLPAAFVDVDDLADIPFQICDNGIKPSYAASSRIRSSSNSYTFFSAISPSPVTDVFFQRVFFFFFSGPFFPFFFFLLFPGKSLHSKSRITFCFQRFESNLFVLVSRKRSKARGIPSASMKSPMVTSGLGLCSLLFPYFLFPFSSSISK